jgi:hypothetical protein
MEMFEELNRDRKPDIVIFVMALLLWSMPATAQVGEQDRDPFFSAGPRSTATESTPPRDGDWGRDPFSHPFEGKTQPQKTKDEVVRVREKILTGILFSADVRVAIIGGEALSEGSLLGDQKLVEIRTNSVVLMNSAGVREEVFLEEVPIRK